MAPYLMIRILFLFLILSFTGYGQSSTDIPDNTSKVPYYTFPETLEEQEEALKTNPLMLRFAESRERLSNDPYRPNYHFVNPEGRLNDPYGLCFWHGNWHLFYQAYPLESPRQHWRHAISKDLIHWRDLPFAIYPHPERAAYSGSTYVKDNRVIAHYHGRFADNMVVISSDPLLINRESVGFSKRSKGQKCELISLDAWQMINIWDVLIDEWHK